MITQAGKDKGTWETGGDRSFAFDPNSTENEGRFRLLPPGDITDYFRRKSSTPGVSYVMGKDEDGKTKIQAIRFDKSEFSEKQAEKWYADNKARLEKRHKQKMPKTSSCVGWYKAAQSSLCLKFR